MSGSTRCAAPESRSSARIRSRRLLVVAAVASAAVLGCSSMPFMPKEGGGAGFTLATVDHVAAREAALRTDLRRELEAELDARLDARLAETRGRVETLEQSLASQQLSLESLVQRLDAGDIKLEEGLAALREQIATLGVDALELRQIARGLDTRMQGMPRATLRELDRAIDAHLSAPAVASEPPSPAPVSAPPPVPAKPPVSAKPESAPAD